MRGENNGYMNAEAWTVAMAKRGFTVLDGKVYHGSGGHIVEVPVPNWSDPGVQAMVAQALAEYGCNRIVQGAKNGEAQDSLNKAFLSGDVDAGDDGDESRRTKLVEGLIAKEITRRVHEKNPTASEAQIASTIAKFHDDIGRQIVASGKYAIVRKKAGAKDAGGETAEAVDIL